MLADRIRMSVGKTKKLIDRTAPTLVVDQPYRTTGNGGRKLVRLDNGWLVTVLYDASTKYTYFYVSKNNGASWAKLTQTSSGLQYEYSAIVNNGNYIYCLLASTTGAVRYVHFNAENISGYVVINNIENQSYVSSCSLEINEEGTELHACWSSKNSTYPNSFNIRYCKGAINTDGSVTWGNVGQISNWNDNRYNIYCPNIVVNYLNEPIIISYEIINGAYYIIINRIDPNTSEGNSSVIVYYSNSYAQVNPSACVDKDGVIHVAWSGKVDDYEVRIFYSCSKDNGISWSNPLIIPIVSRNYSYPSISANKNGRIFICSAPDAFIYNSYSDDGVGWASFDSLLDAYEPSLIDDNTLDFEEPLYVCMTTSNHPTNPNSVLFRGKWYE